MTKERKIDRVGGEIVVSSKLGTLNLLQEDNKISISVRKLEHTVLSS